MYPAVHAKARPDKPAVIMDNGETLSYRELEEGSSQCAHRLRERYWQGRESSII